MSKPGVLIAESGRTMAKFLMTNLKLLGCEGLSNRRPKTQFVVPLYCPPISPLLPDSCPIYGGALLATELQKASPQTSPMILDVLR